MKLNPRKYQYSNSAQHAQLTLLIFLSSMGGKWELWSLALGLTALLTLGSIWCNYFIVAKQQKHRSKRYSLQRVATEIVADTCLGKRSNRWRDCLSRAEVGTDFGTEWRWEIDLERQWKNHWRNRGSDREDAGKVGMGSVWSAENLWLTGTNWLFGCGGWL